MKTSYSGRRGDIWLHSQNDWWAIEFTRFGTERLTRGIPDHRVEFWLKHLGVPTDKGTEAWYAAHFPNTRAEIDSRIDALSNPLKSLGGKRGYNA